MDGSSYQFQTVLLLMFLKVDADDCIFELDFFSTSSFFELYLAFSLIISDPGVIYYIHSTGNLTSFDYPTSFNIV